MGNICDGRSAQEVFKRGIAVYSAVYTFLIAVLVFLLCQVATVCCFVVVWWVLSVVYSAI